jgi:hypothetical protein
MQGLPGIQKVNPVHGQGGAKGHFAGPEVCGYYAKVWDLLKELLEIADMVAVSVGNPEPFEFLRVNDAAQGSHELILLGCKAAINQHRLLGLEHECIYSQHSITGYRDVGRQNMNPFCWRV